MFPVTEGEHTMRPDRAEAERLLLEAESCNPGTWGGHSRTAARCAEKIALRSGLDPEKAYVLALLHDIGRKFGRMHLRHVYLGYTYMLSLGYDEAARICLTHSFPTHTVDEFIGNFDVTDEELQLLRTKLAETVYDDYDRLVILCDAVAGPEGPMDMKERMDDVKSRYGFYPQEKWEANLRLKTYFEEKMGEDLKRAVSD